MFFIKSIRKHKMFSYSIIALFSFWNKKKIPQQSSNYGYFSPKVSIYYV